MANIYQRAESLIAAMDALNGVLEAETVAIRSHDYACAAARQPAKLEAAGRYEREFVLLQEAVRETPVPGALRERIATMTDRLDRTIADNAIALLAARDTHQRVIDVLVAEANRQRNTGFGYTAAGIAASDAVPRRRGALPVSYNAKI